MVIGATALGFPRICICRGGLLSVRLLRLCAFPTPNRAYSLLGGYWGAGFLAWGSELEGSGCRNSIGAGPVPCAALPSAAFIAKYFSASSSPSREINCSFFLVATSASTSRACWGVDHLLDFGPNRWHSLRRIACQIHIDNIVMPC